MLFRSSSMSAGERSGVGASHRSAAGLALVGGSSAGILIASDQRAFRGNRTEPATTHEDRPTRSLFGRVPVLRNPERVRSSGECRSRLVFARLSWVRYGASYSDRVQLFRGVRMFES